MTTIRATIIDTAKGVRLAEFTGPAALTAAMPRIGELVEIRIDGTVETYRVEDVVHEYDASRNGDQPLMPIRILVRRFHG